MFTCTRNTRDTRDAHNACDTLNALADLLETLNNELIAAALHAPPSHGGGHIAVDVTASDRNEHGELMLALPLLLIAQSHAVIETANAKLG